MIKLFFALFLSAMCVFAGAADSAWNVYESKSSKSNVPTGYIYYTNAIGTKIEAGKKPLKVPTSLRIICSLTGDDPIVAVLWDTGAGNDSLLIITTVDNMYTDSMSWNQEGQLIYRKLYESPSLILGLKSGRVIKFEWISGNTITYTTAFSLVGLNITNFNTKCKTQI